MATSIEAKALKKLVTVLWQKLSSNKFQTVVMRLN